MHVLQVFYHGGLDANNPTRPWADDVLEVVDADTLEVYFIAYPAASPELMTRRYRHVMAAFEVGVPSLVMAGGQMDDPSGLSINTLNVLGVDIAARNFFLLRDFTQPGGQADVLFSTVQLKGHAMSFVSTVMPYSSPLESQRALRVLNLTDNTMSDGIVSFTVSKLTLRCCACMLMVTQKPLAAVHLESYRHHPGRMQAWGSLRFCTPQLVSMIGMNHQQERHRGLWTCSMVELSLFKPSLMIAARIPCAKQRASTGVHVPHPCWHLVFADIVHTCVAERQPAVLEIPAGHPPQPVAGRAATLPGVGSATGCYSCHHDQFIRHCKVPCSSRWVRRCLRVRVR